MALKKTVTFENGVTVTNAYIKIASVGTDKNYANVAVRYYADRENPMSIYEHIYVFKPDMTDKAANLWKQSYEHLKTLPEFSDAEDVLEVGQQA